MLRAVFLADLHVGSRWGLADPDVTPRDCPGREVQAALFAQWKADTQGEFAAPDALIVAGDAIDGQGVKDAGTHQWTTDIQGQINHAAALLRMWKAKEIYIIGGSKYHVAVGNTGLSGEELLAQKLQAVEYPNQQHLRPEDRRRSGPQWFLTFEDTTVHVAHHVSVSRVFHYKSTPIAREMMQAKLNDPMRREWERMYREQCQNGTTTKTLMESLHAALLAYQTRIVIRGHAHYFWACDAGGSLGINLPAWKIPDPWIQERDPLGFTHIGFIGMEFSGHEHTYRKHLCRVEDIARCPRTIVGGVRPANPGATLPHSADHHPPRAPCGPADNGATAKNRRRRAARTVESLMAAVGLGPDKKGAL